MTEVVEVPLEDLMGLWSEYGADEAMEMMLLNCWIERVTQHIPRQHRRDYRPNAVMVLPEGIKNRITEMVSDTMRWSVVTPQKAQEDHAADLAHRICDLLAAALPFLQERVDTEADSIILES